MTLPVLYSFRRCPYAIRARMALAVAGIAYDRVEVELKNKPPALLALSPKGTVPVLQLSDGRVLEESLDIMRYALSVNDPEHWLAGAAEANMLIARNDKEFKPLLDKFKYHTRHLELSEDQHQANGEAILSDLEARLLRGRFLLGDARTIADVALFPFIRQWEGARKDALKVFPHLSAWLFAHTDSDLFKSVMQA